MLKSNLQEVSARGGQLLVFADREAQLSEDEQTQVVNMPSIHPVLAPILYTIPLQLLSYYVAVLKGTDVDQPRNLAKVSLWNNHAQDKPCQIKPQSLSKVLGFYCLEN